MRQPNELLMHVITNNLQVAREYRCMANEFMKKAEDLEASLLKIAISLNEAEAEVCEKAAEKSAKDVFEEFGDLFAKKGSKK
jgi:hypothetical protein